MLPSLSFLQSVPCQGVDPRCCEYAAGNVVFSDQGVPKVFSGSGAIGQPQPVIDDKNFHCSALALSSNGSVVLAGGVDGRLLWIRLSESRACVEIKVPSRQAKIERIAVKCIAPDADDKHAAGLGRYVYLIDSNGIMTNTLGPLNEEVVQLHWAKHQGAPSCLVALTATACYLWPQGGHGNMIFIPCEDNTMTTLAASPSSAFIAAACQGCKVQCWSVNKVVAAAEEGMPLPKPITLGSYDDPVRCMAWDSEGTYLATSDGSDCTVWDMSGVGTEDSGIECADSVMCCGHDPATFITSLAFQPDGPLLASVSNTGKLAVFDSGGFRRGGVVGPYATAHFDDAAVGEPHLLWLPQSRLLVAVPGGRMLCYAAGEPEGIQPVVGFEGEMASRGEPTPIDQACVEYMCSPLTPPTLGSAELPGGEAPPASAEVEAEGEVEEEQRQLQASESSGGRGTGAAEPAATPQAVEGLRTKPEPSPIRTKPRDIPPEEYSGSKTRGASPPQQVVLPPITVSGRRGGGSRHLVVGQSIDSDNSANNNAQYRSGGSSGGVRGADNAARQQQQRRGSGHRRNGAGSGSGGGGGGSQGSSSPTRSSAPGSMSPSLLEHIQQLRDAPPVERPDQHDELTGWGLGVSGGGAPLPWMAAGQSAAQGTPIYPGYAVPMAMQYHHQQYHPAMMAASPAAQLSMQMSMMTQQVPGSSMGQGYASPRSPAAMGGPHGIPPGAVMVPTGMMAPQAAAAWAAVATQSGYPQHHQGAYPLQQAQQAQQWAGVAPGYMTYQHGATYGMPQMSQMSHMAMQQAYPSRLPPSSGSLEQSRQSSGGFTSSSLGIAAVAAAARNNADTEHAVPRGQNNNRGMTDREEFDANNSNNMQRSQHQRGQRSRGSNGSGSSSGAGAAAASGAAALGRAGASGDGDARGAYGRTISTTNNSTTMTSSTMMTHQSPRSKQFPDRHEMDGSLTAASISTIRDDLKLSRDQNGESSYDTRDTSDLNNNNRQGSGSLPSPQRHPSTSTSGDPPVASSGPTADTSSTIYVGNLQPSVDEYALFWTCTHFGPVAHVQIIRDKPSNVSRGFGFVTFAHPAYATVAMQQLNGQVMYGPFGGHRIKAAPTNKRPTPPQSQTPSPAQVTPSGDLRGVALGSP